MNRFEWVRMMALGKVLEIGCADGAIFRNDTTVEWYGIDNWSDILSKKTWFWEDSKIYTDIPEWQKQKMEFYKKCMKERNFFRADGYHLPFKENFFDTIVYAEVLEHVPDPVKFLKQGISLLKDKGRIIITAPDEYFWPREADPLACTDHLHFFTKEALEYIVEQSGLVCKIFYKNREEGSRMVNWFIVLRKE